MMRAALTITVTAIIGAVFCVWFGARVVARPSMMHILLDSPRPTPTSQPIPTSFLEAGRMACEHYVVDYRVWLSIRWCEMGRRNMEMGIQGRNAAIEAKHPYFPQAYWTAYMLAKRQREFCADKKLQAEYAKYKSPYVAYVCRRWHPWQWKAYYWNGKGNGVGAVHHKYSAVALERKIDKKVEEKWGAIW